jgi:hypothetical protein
VYDENSEVDEEVLKEVIDDVLVSDAIKVYQLLQNKGQSKSHQSYRDFVAGLGKLQVAVCCDIKSLIAAFTFSLFSLFCKER